MTRRFHGRTSSGLASTPLFKRRRPAPGLRRTFLPLVGPLPPDTDFVRVGDRQSRLRLPCPPALSARGQDHETIGVSPGQGATARRADAGSGIDQRAVIVSAGREHSRPPRGWHCPATDFYPRTPGLPPGASPPALFRRGWRLRFRPFGKSRARQPNDGLYEAAAAAGQFVGVNPGPRRRAAHCRARANVWSPEWLERSLSSRGEASSARMRSYWATACS